MPWEAYLDNIRQGKIPVSNIGENGFPAMMSGAPFPVLLQFLAALVHGYNLNYLKIQKLRHFVKKEKED